MLTFKPDADAPQVQALCDQLVQGNTPVLVECQPLPGQPFNECFAIVEKQVATHGGHSLTGWALWEVPGVYIEAEFHAVWQRPDERLVCITPRPHRFDQILFLPDPTRKYAGRQIDNVREALVRDNDVTRFLHLHRMRFQILNEGDLANQHGLISLDKKVARQLGQLEKDMAHLQRRLAKRYALPN